MKLIDLFKKTFLIIIFLMPAFILPQDSLMINEKLPDNVEKLDLIFKTQNILGQSITLFNTSKSKVIVGDYGVADIKKRTPSYSTTKIIGITYNETKYKFFIDFMNALNQSSELIGTKKTSNVLESINATISTPSENSRSWDLVLKINFINVLNNDLGTLTNGERTINIIRTNYLSFENNTDDNEMNPETFYIEFIENGIALSAFIYGNEKSIWLKSDLDSTIKLMLCTAMLSMAN